MDHGQIVILALIAPLVQLRAVFAERLGADYREVWCSASLAVCEQRDPKGLYARARSGLLPEFTGIDSAYQPPTACECLIETAGRSVDDGVGQLLEVIGRIGGGHH